MAKFHSKEGWFFERQEDGLVTITSSPPSEPQEVAKSVTLDADTWASVVASVSAQGETREQWDAARTLHGAHE